MIARIVYQIIILTGKLPNKNIQAKELTILILFVFSFHIDAKYLFPSISHINHANVSCNVEVKKVLFKNFLIQSAKIFNFSEARVDAKN